MKFNDPYEIYKQLQEGKLSKKVACEIFYNLIIVSKNEIDRLESLQLLENLESNSRRLFLFLENLLISESSKLVRNYTIKILQKRFLPESLTPLAWRVKFEKDLTCFVNIIETLALMETSEAKKILFQELESIFEKKYFDKRKLHPTKGFLRSFQCSLDGKALQNLPIKVLKDVITNFKVVSAIFNKYLDVFFDWNHGRVVKLDLSEIGWSILRSWRQNYSDRITDTSEIPGLIFLKNLETLNLSNNRIKNIENLKHLRSLTTLIIANNKLQDPINIEYLKALKNLKYLDIRGNKIAEEIDEKDFSNVKIISKTNLIFL
jgi:hypothetical protein